MNQITEPTAIRLHDIVFDAELQMRANDIDTEFVETLAEKLEKPSIELTPVVVFLATDVDRAALNIQDGRERYFLADGWHRSGAYNCATRDTIPAYVHQGGREAAFKFALGANADQDAKPRTRRDLRKAVRAALQNLYFGKKKTERASQTEIAELCKTTQQTVSNILREMQNKQVSRANERERKEQKKQQPGDPNQTDFFEVLLGDYNNLLSHSRSVRESPIYRQVVTTNPARAADELEAIAAALRAEYQELKRFVSDLRTGTPKKES